MTNGHQQPWRGVFPALCTPFGEDGALDEEAQRAVVRFALAGGAHGAVCFGLAGEVNKLTPEERKRLTRVIVAEVAGRVPVLVGVGAEATHTAIELARCAEDAGADGVVIPPPITAHAGAEELAAHFCAVAAATALPAVIQDAPDYLGVEVGSGLVLRASTQQPNIRYVKVETGPEGTAHWVKELGDRVGVFTGSAGLHLVADLRAGAAGNVPGTEITDLLVEVYRAERAEDGAQGPAVQGSPREPAGSLGLWRRLLPYLVFALQDIDHYNACTKEVLVRRGILRHGGLRPPAPKLTALAQTLLDTYVAEMGLLA